MLEYWVYRNRVCFCEHILEQNTKQDYHPTLIARIPLFHYSIIPLRV
ncbi:hypothetical protein D1AOALGA4SA_2861 [Olavius algarvensis Delta 1 endosymbiont]|nr:hypothetical protein D1AOALGA4SA_2861 [Olavius algarvensis Delta 1 endosymbiont]